MEIPKPSAVFTPEQIAAIEEMFANRPLSAYQRQQVEGMLTKPRPRDFSLVAGSSHPKLAQKIADSIGMPLCNANLKKFDCGENYVRLKESVRNKVAFLIQTCRKQETNNDLMELFIMSSTAWQASSESRVAVIPYLGYARQDRIAEIREPITAKLIADLAKASKIDRAIICHLHADQEMGFFDFQVDHVHTIGLFADYYKQKNLMSPVVVATDAGGAKKVKLLAKALNTNFAIVDKYRLEHNKSEVTGMIGDVRGRICIIFDDIVDTAGSVCNAYETLTNLGASQVSFGATHGVLSGPAIERLEASGIDEVAITDTLPLELEKEKQCKKIKVISAVPLIVEKMRNVVDLPSPAENLDKVKFTDGGGI